MSASLQKLNVYDQDAIPSAHVSQDQATATADGDWYWRPLTVLVGFWLFAGVVGICFDAGRSYLDQPIREVRVVGDAQYLDRQALASSVAGAISAPLLEQDIAALQDRAQEHPWVRQAQVRRVWPPAIEVVIEEQRPVARWGSKGLLNHQGDIFWPDSPQQYGELPQLDGPATETQLLMAQYHDLSRLFQDASLKMVALSLEKRGAWQVKLDNGIRVIVGREDTKARLRRFIYLYKAELVAVADRIEQIDIRYTNGAAVSWLPEPTEALAEEAK
ncbi:cell division protein FtsQ/DivIB [Neptunomonas marina]|uniref:Cell division protein FtsQ n=1 Tax=Neptunomonas marina TaxID=1815562 RepID=A0A437Q7N2_9GAMM|nr:cell division protein FtsQ/DivIB [Neptunomonas marina]RVU30486.1 cell division protein FtsQ/DivIB [Neptunomonas marina]